VSRLFRVDGYGSRLTWKSAGSFRLLSGNPLSKGRAFHSPVWPQESGPRTVAVAQRKISKSNRQNAHVHPWRTRGTTSSGSMQWLVLSRISLQGLPGAIFQPRLPNEPASQSHRQGKNPGTQGSSTAHLQLFKSSTGYPSLQTASIGRFTRLQHSEDSNGRAGGATAVRLWKAAGFCGKARPEPLTAWE
jgi:hypothetical protein